MGLTRAEAVPSPINQSSPAPGVAGPCGPAEWRHRRSRAEAGHEAVVHGSGEAAGSSARQPPARSAARVSYPGDQPLDRRRAMMDVVEDLGDPRLSLVQTSDVLGLSRATAYRQTQPLKPPSVVERAPSPRKLSDTEQAVALAVLQATSSSTSRRRRSMRRSCPEGCTSPQSARCCVSISAPENAVARSATGSSATESAATKAATGSPTTGSAAAETQRGASVTESARAQTTKGASVTESALAFAANVASFVEASVSASVTGDRGAGGRHDPGDHRGRGRRGRRRRGAGDRRRRRGLRPSARRRARPLRPRAAGGARGG